MEKLLLVRELYNEASAERYDLRVRCDIFAEKLIAAEDLADTKRMEALAAAREACCVGTN